MGAKNMYGRINGYTLSEINTMLVKYAPSKQTVDSTKKVHKLLFKKYGKRITLEDKLYRGNQKVALFRCRESEHGIFAAKTCWVYAPTNKYKEPCPKCLKIKTEGYQKGKPLYHTFKGRLTVEEKPLSTPNGYLTVKCTHCKKRFIPKISAVWARVYALEGRDYSKGEKRLYCSESCKISCVIYGLSWDMYENLHIHQSDSRIRRSEYRRAETRDSVKRAVLERDGHSCVMCCATDDLEVHHISPIAVDPDLVNDTDNLITLCHMHHLEAHTPEECSYKTLSKVVTQRKALADLL